MMKADEVEGCRAGRLGGSGMFWVLGEGGSHCRHGGRVVAGHPMARRHPWGQRGCSRGV